MIPKAPFFILTCMVAFFTFLRAGSPDLGTYPSTTFSYRPLLLLRGPLISISHPMAPASMVRLRDQNRARR